VAVRLADQGGVESLSMRKLAQELGVEAMSLYHHVKNKEDILDGMVDIVSREIELPAYNTDWKEAIRNWATSLRTVLTRHPWAIGLMYSRATPSLTNMQNINTVIGCFRRAGFSVQMAANALSLLDSYIYGFVLQEVNLPFGDSSEFAEGVEGIAQQLPPDDFPFLLELSSELVLQPGYSYGNQFQFGFDLILESLDTRLKVGLDTSQ
jgi:AcrR family transcriptional regulator